MANQKEKAQNPWRKTFDEWCAEGYELFGKDRLQWKFVCPACGRVQTAQEFMDKHLFGIELDAINSVYQNCIGRFKEDEGCNWNANGLFCTPFVVVTPDEKEHHVFDFARN